MGGTTCHRLQRSGHRSHLWHRHTCHHHQAWHCPLHRITRLKLSPLFHPQQLCHHTHLLCRQAHLQWYRLVHPSPCLLPHPPQFLLVHLRLLVAWPHQQRHLHAWLHPQRQCPHHLGLAREGTVVACGVWPSRLCQKTSCRRQWTMLAARMEWIARRLLLVVAASIQTTLHRTHHMRSIAIGRR